jgi:uncharacterized membrane protein YkgB
MKERSVELQDARTFAIAGVVALVLVVIGCLLLPASIAPLLAIAGGLPAAGCLFISLALYTS